MRQLLLMAVLVILTSCATIQPSPPEPISSTVFLINSNSEAIWNGNNNKPFYYLEITDLNTNVLWQTNTIETNQFIGDICNSLQAGRYYFWLKEEIAYNVDSDWTNRIIQK